MEKKKKNTTLIKVIVVIYVVLLYLALHMAPAYDKAVEESGDARVSISVVMENFEERLSTKPLKFEITENTSTFVIVLSMAILIGVAYYFNNQKNYIDNKEYGTSEWGTKAQINHLRAESIRKVEINKIKKRKDLSLSDKQKQIERAKELYADESNIIYTQTEKICMFNYELNNNVMIIGGSGSGKTRGYVLPNILQCTKNPNSPSIVVTDPKGEILSKVGHHLERNGYVIKVLNLKEQNRSFCFNPFAYVMEERFEEQISALITSIFDSRSGKDEVSSQDPFWEDMAKVLLKAIFYVVYECYPKEEQNMETVMKLFRLFEVSDMDERYENPTQLDTLFAMYSDKDGCYLAAKAIMDFYKSIEKTVNYTPKLPITYDRISKYIAVPLGTDQCQGCLAYLNDMDTVVNAIEQKREVPLEIQVAYMNARETINEYCAVRMRGYTATNKPIGVTVYEKYGDINSNPATRNWEDFRTKCKGKTAQSVTATALSKLAPFDEQQIRRIFSKDEMELDLVGERKTALFIILPPTNKSYNFIGNLLYTVLFEQLEYCATVKHNQRLPIPVRFICDEFYNTGRIPNFENILSYARSFGIGISIILQSLDQIKEMYEKSWGTVLDNCSVFLYLGGIRHIDTLEYISKILGKGTFDKKTTSRSKGKSGSFNTNYDKIGRELMDASEIQRMKKDKCLLFVSGYQPYFSQKFDYPSHKNYRYTSDSGNVPPYVYKIPSEKGQVE